MYLAYSALRPAHKSLDGTTRNDNTEMLKAHYAVCKKYTQEIAAIRKYFPDWQPVLNNQLINNRK